MSTSLSRLVDNLSNSIIKNGKCGSCGSNLEYIAIRKSGRLILECYDCKRRYSEKFSEKLEKKFIKKFKNTYGFCNKDINKFMLLLRKVIYPYEYMNDWNRFDEEKLPNKSDFYSSLNMEEISGIVIDMLKKYFINLILKI